MKCVHLNTLIEELSKLPAIGNKSARRIALHFLGLSQENMHYFLDTLREAYALTQKCHTCGSLTEVNPCDICSGSYAGQGILCVIEQASEVNHMLRLLPQGSKIHVLGGKLSPLRGVSPEHLNMEALFNRLTEEGLKEVLIATSPDAEGEATAFFLKEKLNACHVKASRLSFGVSFSTSLETADERSIQKSIESRISY